MGVEAKPPGAPVALETRANSIVLFLTPSETENVLYIIEQRKVKEREWNVASTKYFITSTSTRVYKLKEKTRYAFRVVPVNRDVRGQPSKPSKVIMAKNPFSKINIFNHILTL